MKKPLSVLFVFVLFILNCSAFAASDSNHSRIGKLPCPRVLANCTNIIGLEEEEYLPPMSQDQEIDDYLVEISKNYSSEQLQNTCKSCVVAQSRDSKCIRRGLKKCRKNFSDSEI